MKLYNQNTRSVSLRAARITRAAMGVCLIVVGAVFTLPVGPTPVTLQTLAVMLLAVTLTPVETALAVSAYIVLGCFGLPIFAGGSGGLGALLGPTGGFLLSFLPAGVMLSALSKKVRHGAFLLCGLLAFNLAVYVMGTVWFAALYGEGMGLAHIMSVCVLPFLPGDALKCAAVMLTRPAIKNIRFM